MPKIAITSFETARPLADPSPHVTSKALFGGSAYPLHAEVHDLKAGAELAWHGVPTGRLGFVWDGRLSFGGTAIGKGGIFIIEHGASGSVTADADARLLVFHQADDAAAAADSRPGGHTHVLRAGDVPRIEDLSGTGEYGAALFADSHCPTCELWMHENSYPGEGYEVPLHSHNEDEIIVVTEGEIVLGPRRYGPGTAISVNANTLYGFHTGKGGLTYINFRPKSPTHVGKENGRITDEYRFYHAALSTPPYLTAAVA